MVSIDTIKKNDVNEIDQVLAFLSRQEERSLFLYTNLKSEKIFSQYYIVRSDSGDIVGVAAYFPLFQSCSLFTEEETVARMCVRILARHHVIKAFLGIASCGIFAYDEFIKLGYISKKNPKTVFMELECKDFHFFEAKEGFVRPVKEEDIDQIVMLQRYLHEESVDSPIREEERERIRANPVKFCLERDGSIVCVAISSGIAKKVFQILGVITHPQHRRKGFAKAVCSHLIRYFWEKEHAEKAVLFTDYDNFAALSCYRSVGFHSTDEYYVAYFST